MVPEYGITMQQQPRNSFEGMCFTRSVWLWEELLNFKSGLEKAQHQVESCMQYRALWKLAETTEKRDKILQPRQITEHLIQGETEKNWAVSDVNGIRSWHETVG